MSDEFDIAIATPGGGNYAVIPVNNLTVDEIYQRDLDQKRIDTMVREYDANLVSPPVVARATRRGMFFVVDGQHTVEMLRRLSVPDVLCRVVKATREEQAEMFVAIQSSRKDLSQWQLHRALLASGHPQARAIQRIVSSAGSHDFKVAPSISDPGTLSAVASLYRIVFGEDARIGRRMGKGLGELVLKVTLEFIEDAWGLFNQDARRYTTIEGLAHIFAAVPEIDKNRLHDKMAAIEPKKLKARKELLAQSELRGSHATLTAGAILTYYNEGLTKDKKVDLKRVGVLPPKGMKVSGKLLAA